MTIACTLDDGDRGTRRDRWRRIGADGVGGVVETPTGLRLVFRSSAPVARELRELAELERECCAFATWTVRDEGAHMVLDVESEGEGVAALHGMFTNFRATLAGAA
jgi:hypothetical protein